MENETCGCFPKKQRFTLSVIAMIGLILILSLALRRSPKDNIDENYTMTVSAEGQVVAKPDIAIITIGVKTPRQLKIEKVVSDNTIKMNKIIKAIKDSGIKDNDIKTTSYNLYPVYDYLENKGRVLRGYELDQRLQVKIRDMETVGKTIDLATKNGANEVSNVSFTIDDTEEFKNQAREEAIQKAKAKAKSMSKLSGINLGRVVNVSENFGSNYPVSYDSAYSTRSMGGMKEAEQANIQVGENEINVTVNLTYEIK